jgi:hypothetical protein
MVVCRVLDDVALAVDEFELGRPDGAARLELALKLGGLPDTMRTLVDLRPCIDRDPIGKHQDEARVQPDLAMVIQEVGEKVEPLRAVDGDEERVVRDQPESLGREELVLVKAQDRCEEVVLPVPYRG